MVSDWSCDLMWFIKILLGHINSQRSLKLRHSSYQSSVSHMWLLTKTLYYLIVRRLLVILKSQVQHQPSILMIILSVIQTLNIPYAVCPWQYFIISRTGLSNILYCTRWRVWITLVEWICVVFYQQLYMYILITQQHHDSLVFSSNHNILF